MVECRIPDRAEVVSMADPYVLAFLFRESRINDEPRPIRRSRNFGTYSRK